MAPETITETMGEMGNALRETVCRQVADEQLSIARVWWSRHATGEVAERAFVLGMCTAAALSRLQGPITRATVGQSPEDVSMLSQKFFREVTGLEEISS